MPTFVYISIILQLSSIPILYVGGVDFTDEIAKAAPWSPHEDIVAEILRGYKADQFPNVKPLAVTVSLVVQEIRLSDEDQDRSPRLSTTLFMTESWHDPRLVFRANPAQVPFVVVPNKYAIWFPDISFFNSARAKPFLMQHYDRLVRVYPDGTVRVNQRLYHAFSCPMDVYFYPFESAICNIDITTFAFTKDQLYLRWNQSKPIKVFSGRHKTQFDLKGTMAADYSSEAYSCIRGMFEFSRNSGSKHVFEMFFVPGVFVSLSWVGFVLPNYKKAGIGCMALVFIAFSLIVSQVYQNFPLARLSVVHTWIAGCGYFIVSEIITVVILCLSEQLAVSPHVELLPEFIVRRINQLATHRTTNGSLLANQHDLNENEDARSNSQLMPDKHCEYSENKWVMYCRLAVFGFFVASFCIFTVAVCGRIPGMPHLIATKLNDPDIG